MNGSVHSQSIGGLTVKNVRKEEARVEDRDGGLQKKTVQERKGERKNRRVKPAGCRQRYRALAKRKQKGDRHLALLLSLGLGPILKWSRLSVNNLL